MRVNTLAMAGGLALDAMESTLHTPASTRDRRGGALYHYRLDTM